MRAALAAYATLQPMQLITRNPNLRLSTSNKEVVIAKLE